MQFIFNFENYHVEVEYEDVTEYFDAHNELGQLKTYSQNGIDIVNITIFDQNEQDVTEKLIKENKSLYEEIEEEIERELLYRFL